MRIVIVTQRYYPMVGGAEQALRSLARGFAHCGHDVRVLAARYNRDLLPHERVDNVPVRRVPLPPVRFLGTAWYIGELLRVLSGYRNRADILYVSMLKHAAWAALQARRRNGLPVVLRAEGAGDTGDVAWQRRALFGQGIAATCRQADAIIAVSRAVRDELMRFGYPRDRVHLIPNAVDCDRFRPATDVERLAARNRLGIRGPVVLYLGRIAPEKGVDLLAAAWQHVHVWCPQAVLLVAGSPSDDALTELLEPLPGVRLLGPSSDVRTLLHAADVFVLPSRFEGTSMALLEAMASGLAVVVTDIPGNREVIGENTDTALVVPADSATSLAHAIRQLIEDASLRSRLGQRARARVVGSFSLEQSVRRHLELFRTLIEQRWRGWRSWTQDRAVSSATDRRADLTPEDGCDRKSGGFEQR